ncbi:MAG TPA: hypothetical protein VFG37_03880 [Planctomycetota bacterium]|nr:hypothetical protein [Planctomycetota bacterium]
MRTRRHLLAFVGLAVACGGGGSGGAGVVPRGARSFGLAVGAAEDGDYDGAFGKARALGMDVTSLSLGWDDVEVSPGVFSNPFLAVAESYYPPSGTGVVLAISPIDTNVLRVPADLVGLAFDDPAVIARFDDMIDWVFTQIPTLDVPVLSIGNEVDVWLGTDATLWSQYTNFFAAVRAHVASVRPGLPVGVKATWNGLTGAAKDFLAGLNAATDAVLATYYPLQSGFFVLPTTTVADDFDLLCALYPGRPIEFLEFGAPSSALLGSSDLVQAAFVDALFEAWDAHADQIPLAFVDWQTDVSPAQLSQLEAYYGISDPNFLAYLGTLGLRTYPGSGTDKLGWTTLATQLAIRGW